MIVMLGQEPLQWAFIVIAMTLIFIVFAINPLQAAIDEAIKNHAQLQAERLVSAINLATAAPEGTSYVFEMPKLKCKVKITDSFVKMIITPVAGVEISHTTSIIKTPVTIPSGEFECKANSRIEMKRTGDRLDIFFR